MQIDLDSPCTGYSLRLILEYLFSKKVHKCFDASLNYLQKPEGRAEILLLEQEQDHE